MNSFEGEIPSKENITFSIKSPLRNKNRFFFTSGTVTDVGSGFVEPSSYYHLLCCVHFRANKLRKTRIHRFSFQPYVKIRGSLGSRVFGGNQPKRRITLISKPWLRKRGSYSISFLSVILNRYFYIHNLTFYI